MTTVKKQDSLLSCGICNRTLLLGERAVRFSPGGDQWVDVCPLCTETASEQGWLKEGTPTTPLVSELPRRRWRLPGLRLLETRREEPEPTLPEPMLRRLSTVEQAIVEAAEIYNASPFRRTIGGIAKSLGGARVSLLPLSGVNREVVVTIAWEVSWYQYRVVFDSAQAIRLAERGHELDELDDRFKGWNGHLDVSGRIVPDIPRI